MFSLDFKISFSKYKTLKTPLFVFLYLEVLHNFFYKTSKFNLRFFIKYSFNKCLLTYFLFYSCKPKSYVF